MSIATPAISIIKKLQQAGFIAYLAGGCVRDQLLGRIPHDYDVATNAQPYQVEQLFPRTIAVGAQFGVIIVIEEEGDVEVATFRHDGSYKDGRHPIEVTFSTPQEDALRRDFTINGLFEDPLTDPPRLIDYVSGKADLEKRVIRAIGDPLARFQEDQLRLLRTVRFATTLDFEIEPSTWQATVKMAPSIQSISQERIREELQKTLQSPHRLRGFDLLDQSGLLATILPEIEKLKGCEQSPEFHPEGDVFLHTRLMLSLLPAEASWPLVMAVLCHDIGKPATQRTDPESGKISFYGHEGVGAKMTQKLLQRLRCSNALIEEVVTMVRLHMSFKDVPQMRLATLRKMIARPTFHQELELHRVDCLSSHGMLSNYHLLQKKEVELTKTFSQEKLIPEPLLSGKDLIRLGGRPGPLFSTILNNLKEAQLENLITTRDEAILWVRQHYDLPPKNR